MSYDLHLFRPWAKHASPDELMNCMDGELSDPAHRLALNGAERRIIEDEWTAHWTEFGGRDDAPAHYIAGDCSLDLHLTYAIEGTKSRQISARFQRCAQRLAQRLDMVIYDPQEDQLIEPSPTADPDRAAARFEEGRSALESARRPERQSFWRRLLGR